MLPFEKACAWDYISYRTFWDTKDYLKQRNRDRRGGQDNRTADQIEADEQKQMRCENLIENINKILNALQNNGTIAP